MNKKNRTCAVCRENYSYCPHCGEDKDKPTWYFTFCSSNCKDIYDVTSKFENKQITEYEAKKTLDKLDLYKVNNFGQSYKSSIEKINTVKTAVKEEKTIEEEQVIEDEEMEIKKSKKAKRNVE